MRLVCFFIFFGPILSLSVNAQTYSGSGGNIPDNGPPVEFTIEINDLTPSTLNGDHGLINVWIINTGKFFMENKWSFGIVVNSLFEFIHRRNNR